MDATKRKHICATGGRSENRGLPKPETNERSITIGIIPPEGALGVGIISLAVFPSYAIAVRRYLRQA